MTTVCGCGIPSRANFYVTVVLLRATEDGAEAGVTDVYMCAEHMPVLPIGRFVGSEMSAQDISTVRSGLKFDGAEDWYVVEFTVAALR